MHRVDADRLTSGRKIGVSMMISTVPSMKEPATRMNSTIRIITRSALSVTPSIALEIISGTRSNTMP